MGLNIHLAILSTDMEKRKPGFYPEPMIMCLSNGNYLLTRDVYYVSAHLDEPQFIEAPYEFSPSIPRIFRRIVPVCSRVVLASLPHDDGYQKQPDGISRRTWDRVGFEILDRRDAPWTTKYGFYVGLRLGGFKAWNKNKRTLKEAVAP